MNPQLINDCAAQMTAQIADLQDAINALHKVRCATVPHGTILPGASRASQQAPRKGRRARAVRPGPAVPSAVRLPPARDLFPPKSLGAAMKLCIAARPKFSQAELRADLQARFPQWTADEKFDTNFYGNLAYWTKTDRLSKRGEGAEAGYELRDVAWCQPVE